MHPSQSTLQGLGRNRFWFIGLLGFLVFIVFMPVKNFDYLHYDDPHFITNVPEITGGLSSANVSWALGSRDQRNWIPLARWSHQLDATLFGNNPGLAHLVSLFWHALNAALVFLLLHRLGLPNLVAWLAALAWALHPMQVECVAWLSNRKHLLAATATLVASLCWWPSPQRSSPRWVWASFFLALSSMSRPTAVLLPLAWLAGDTWVFREARRPRISWRELLLPGIVVLTSVGLTLWSQSLPVHELMQSPSPLKGFWIAPAAAWELACHVVIPSSLSFHYPIPNELPWREAICGGLLIVLAVGLVMLAKRRRPLISLAIVLSLVLWIPASGMIPMGDLLTADRFAYLPLLGLLLTAGDLLSSLPSRWRNGILLLAIASWGALTFHSLKHWKDSPTLFAHAVSCQPGDPLPHTQLGMWHVSNNELQEAKRHLIRATEVEPSCLMAQYNLSVTLLQLGEPQEALPHLDVVVNALPKFADARWNRAQCYFQLAQLPKSLAEVKAVLDLKPNHLPAQARFAELQALVEGKQTRQRRPQLHKP